MASYAALVSLQTLLYTIKTHPTPPIFLHNHHYESLLEKVIALQRFLELYSHRDDYPTDGLELERRIIIVAQISEDVIETCIVDRIEGSIDVQVSNRDNRFYEDLLEVNESLELLSDCEDIAADAGDHPADGVITTYIIDLIKISMSHVEDSSSNHRFYHDLQRVIDDMDFLKKQAMVIKERLGDDEVRGHSTTSISGASSVSPSSGQIMVGFDDVLKDVLHKLTGQPQTSRQIIPIVGMGGIGKTTLALNAYKHPLVAHYFDIRVWTTISQTYDTRNILLEIQRQLGSGEALRKMSDEEIGDTIYKKISGKRYLVILDDMWSIDAWNKIKWFFPNDNNGSRMIVTTRVSNVAVGLTSDSVLQMNFLDEDQSWDLFQKVVFKEDDWPLELKDIGKKIARNCRGLPLSIVVIGGILRKSERSIRHWEYVGSNLSSIVNLDDNEHCKMILQLSYRELPIHLKPCFLYMGIYPEDEVICVSYLVKLWVAEGILKPTDGKSMEVVGKECVKDLVDRSFLSVDLGIYRNHKVL